MFTPQVGQKYVKVIVHGHIKVNQTDGAVVLYPNSMEFWFDIRVHAVSICTIVGTAIESGLRCDMLQDTFSHEHMIDMTAHQVDDA